MAKPRKPDHLVEEFNVAARLSNQMSVRFLGGNILQSTQLIKEWITALDGGDVHNIWLFTSHRSCVESLQNIPGIPLQHHCVINGDLTFQQACAIFKKDWLPSHCKQFQANRPSINPLSYTVFVVVGLDVWASDISSTFFRNLFYDHPQLALLPLIECGDVRTPFGKFFDIMVISNTNVSLATFQNHFKFIIAYNEFQYLLQRILQRPGRSLVCELLCDSASSYSYQLFSYRSPILATDDEGDGEQRDVDTPIDFTFNRYYLPNDLLTLNAPHHHSAWTFFAIYRKVIMIFLCMGHFQPALPNEMKEQIIGRYDPTLAFLLLEE